MLNRDFGTVTPIVRNTYGITINYKWKEECRKYVEATLSVYQHEMWSDCRPDIKEIIKSSWHQTDRLCGLVVRVVGYRSGGPGSIPGTNKKKKI
jgi:hypothetical protein